MSNYNHYKSLYESIKPIRGRAVDVRPIDKRSRDWETIRMDGDVVECVLYKTPVVRYYPDGRIGLQCDSWVTTATAEFMYTHSPFVCRKRNNKIQVNPLGKYADDAKHYPLPEYDETVFVLTPDNKWAPEAPITITKQVVDRAKAKEARAPFMPFIKFVDSFLKMSDGWVMDETMAQVGTLTSWSYGMAHYDFGVPDLGWRGQRGDKFLGSLEIADESDYLKHMCALVQNTDAVEKVMVREAKIKFKDEDSERTVRFYNKRFYADTVKSKIYRMITKNCDVTRSEEVVFE